MPKTAYKAVLLVLHGFHRVIVASLGGIQRLGWSVGVQYSCQDPSEEESIQISLLSRRQPFSSTSYTNFKGEAGKNAKCAVSIVLQLL